MEIEIRKATIKDLENILDLNLKLFKKEHEEFDETLDCKWTKSEEGRKYFSRRIKKGDGCALVASVNGNVVGYLVGGFVKPESYRNVSKMIELEDMYVLNEFRSKGIGTKLYKQFLAWAKKKGAKRLRVTASTKNKRAIEFYKKNGFKDYDTTLEKDI